MIKYPYDQYLRDYDYEDTESNYNYINKQLHDLTSFIIKEDTITERKRIIGNCNLFSAGITGLKLEGKMLDRLLSLTIHYKNVSQFIKIDIPQLLS